MDYLDLLQETIDHIELNLNSDISAEELAHMSGFSLTHYYRLFLIATGKPVMEYITRRRLLHSIYHISLGEKMVDVALTYGFNTYAGFYKAFLKEFHTSPRNYINSHRISKPVILNLTNKEYIMLSHKKINEVLEQWNIEVLQIEDKYYDKNGIIKDNTWIINKNLILNVGSNIQQLKTHIKLSHLLNLNGLNAAVPIKTISEEDYYVENVTLASGS